MKYYVLQVATGREKIFVEHAKKLQPDLSTQCTFIYLTRELTIRRQGKKLKETQPLFASYIFLQSEEDLSADTVQEIKRLPDFYHFLKSNTEIVPLSGADLALLQHFMHLGTKIGASLVTFDKDDRIIVLEGPLKGLEGHIIKVDRRKKRAKIRLDFENSPITMDLSFDVIEKEMTS